MVRLRPHMWKGRRTNESRDDVVARKLVPADQPSRKGLCHGVLRRKWNGGDTPRLTIGQPGDSAAGWAFAIDLTGRCTLQDTEGYVAALEPDCGLYDLGQLAWTFQHITARYSHTGTRHLVAASPRRGKAVRSQVTAQFSVRSTGCRPRGLLPRAPAKSGLDFLTCGDAAQHAGDGRLLGRHGPGDDHEGSSRHLLITKDHARCHHRPRTPSLTSSTRTSCPTYQKHRRRYWPR